MKAIVFFLLAYSSISTIHSQSIEQKERLKSAIQKGQSFLRKVQNAEGAIADTTNPLFNVWETIFAAKAIYESTENPQDSTLQKAIAFLKNNENEQGLICHNAKCKWSYCLETTAEYADLLVKIGKKEKVKAMIPVVSTLQKPEACWEVGNPDVKEVKDFPSVTGFALEIFHLADTMPKDLAGAIHWLQEKQTHAGDWGQAWEYYDTPAYALYANLRALAHFSSSNTPAIQAQALTFIQQQQANGAWFFKATIEGKSPSAELQTALMLSALSYLRLDSHQQSKTLAPAIQFLIENQKENGSWDGGFFPINNTRYLKKEYILATALCVSVLQRELNLYP